MDGVVTAIIIGAVIIAVAISSLKSDDNNNNDDYSYDDGGYSSKKYDIEHGLKRGLNSKEIFEANKNNFKSEDEVDEYIEKLGLADEFKANAVLRAKNPNFLKELEINEVIQEIESTKKNIKEYEEDLALAKKTHNFDEAKSNRDLIKYQEKVLDYNNNKLKELKEELNKHA